MHIALKWVTFVVAVGLVFVITKYGFGPYVKQHEGHKTLDGKTLYRPSDVRTLLDNLGGFRSAYLEQERTVDLIYPLAYGLMFILPIVWLAPGARMPWWLAAVPLATVVADYAENFTVMALLKRYPGDLGGLPTVASIASGLKGLGLLSSTLVIVLLAILWVVRR